MSLRPAERAALSLWLCAARKLDPDCCSSDDQATRDLVDAALSCIHNGAKTAVVDVAADDDISPYLLRIADALCSLGQNKPDRPIELAAAEALLRQMADFVGDFDGESSITGERVRTACGILELAGIIEARIRSLIDPTNRLIREISSIRYVTAFSESPQEFAPFRMNGATNISLSPRVVTLVFKFEGITSLDLWHLAYTLHHELVCHTFQGAFGGNGLRNAHASSHWTEGWMDTVARDLVLDWLKHREAPIDWLPLRGDAAEAAVWFFHNSRYEAPIGLKKDQILSRGRAREACRALSDILSACGMASSVDEAKELSRKFSLSVNSHAHADFKRLDSLGANLRVALLNRVREEIAVEAARSCLAFIGHEDLTKLEADVSSVVQG